MAPLAGRLAVNDLERIARHQLAGVGDERWEWVEYTGRALHLRRRLSREEDSIVGPPIDLRGSEEAQRRFEAVKLLIPAPARSVAAEELLAPT